MSCFNEEWSERYFITDVGVKPACLTCHETVAVFNENNLKRQFKRSMLTMDTNYQSKNCKKENFFDFPPLKAQSVSQESPDK